MSVGKMSFISEMPDRWSIMSGKTDHFVWDKERFRLVITPEYPVMTISDHRDRKAGDVLDYDSFIVKNWEWACRICGK